MENPTTNVNVTFPTWLVRSRDRARVLQMGPLPVSVDAHEKIISEMARRARIDYEENTVIELGAEGEDESSDSNTGDEDDQESDEDID